MPSRAFTNRRWMYLDLSSIPRECQSIDMFALNNKEFAHQYRVDVTDPSRGFMPGTLQAGIDDSSLELQAKLDEEYKQLVEDRHLLHYFVFPQQDSSVPHYLPVNLHRIVKNAKQTFHIDALKPSNLDPAYIIDTLKALLEQLVVVRGDDPLSLEAQQNTTLAFRMHLQAAFSTRRILERHHLNCEAFNWVLGHQQTHQNVDRARYGSSSQAYTCR